MPEEFNCVHVHAFIHCDEKSSSQLSYTRGKVRTNELAFIDDSIDDDSNSHHHLHLYSAFQVNRLQIDKIQNIT